MGILTIRLRIHSIDMFIEKVGERELKTKGIFQDVVLSPHC